MIEFPRVTPAVEPPQKKMSLLEYAHFSERCLRSNPNITSENCLTKNAREKEMVRPFELRGN